MTIFTNNSYSQSEGTNNANRIITKLLSLFTVLGSSTKIILPKPSLPNISTNSFTLANLLSLVKCHSK